jgi:hypothetical protein
VYKYPAPTLRRRDRAIEETSGKAYFVPVQKQQMIIRGFIHKLYTPAESFQLLIQRLKRGMPLLIDEPNNIVDKKREILAASIPSLQTIPTVCSVYCSSLTFPQTGMALR